MKNREHRIVRVTRQIECACGWTATLGDNEPGDRLDQTWMRHQTSALVKDVSVSMAEPSDRGRTETPPANFGEQGYEANLPKHLRRKLGEGP